MKDLKWKRNVMINLLTPIKNQGVWLRYLLASLEFIMKTTNDNNVGLIYILLFNKYQRMLVIIIT